MKWNVSVGIRLSIEYDDIEADSEEEAKQIARVRALEDIDFNNAELDEYGGVTIYCAWSDDEEAEDTWYVSDN
jgi:hypothetical protein